MWRYYAIAAALVLVLGSIASALHFTQRSAPAGPAPQASVHGAAQPAAGLPGGVVSRRTPPPAFVGAGPWVLSALPDCFDQQSAIEGATQALVFHIPPARERVPPGTVFQRGPCTIHVRADDVWVERGADRLRVPPSARLYRTPKGLVLVYVRGDYAEVRRY